VDTKNEGTIRRYRTTDQTDKTNVADVHTHSAGPTHPCHVKKMTTARLRNRSTLQDHGASSCFTLDGGHVGGGVGAAQGHDVCCGDTTGLHVVFTSTDCEGHDGRRRLLHLLENLEHLRRYKTREKGGEAQSALILVHVRYGCDIFYNGCWDMQWSVFLGSYVYTFILYLHICKEIPSSHFQLGTVL